MNANGRDLGFSVIETVVALALLGIVLSLTATALNASRHVLKSIVTHGGHASFVTSMRFVEQRLSDAQPLYESRVGNRARIQFVGEPDRIVFLAAIQGAEFASGIYLVEFGRLGGAKRAVTLRMTPYSLDPLTGVSPSYERLINTGLSKFEIKYFGQDPDTGFESWQEVWRNRNVFPIAVQVEARKRGESTGIIHVPLRTGRPLLSIDK